MLQAEAAEAVVLAGDAEKGLCGVSDNAVEVKAKPGWINRWQTATC